MSRLKIYTVDYSKDLSLRDIEEKLENVEDIEEMLYENTEQLGEVKNKMSNMLEEQGDLKNKVDEISAKLDNTLQSMSKFREDTCICCSEIRAVCLHYQKVPLLINTQT